MVVKHLVMKLLLAAFSVALTLLALVAVEMVLRRRDPDYLKRISADDMNYIHTYCSTYGWRAVRNATSSSEGEITINPRGYRGRVYDYRRTPGRTRIVVLGDSIAFGFGSDDDENFCALLDEENEDLEVVNLAVQGYGTDQALIRLEREGLKYNPDVVLLGFCTANDFVDNASSKYLYDQGYPKPYFVIENGELVKKDRHLKLSPLKRWAFVLSQKSILYNHVLKWMRIDRREHVMDLVPHHVRYPFDREISFRLVRRMAEICREAGVPFTTVIFPTKNAFKLGKLGDIEAFLETPLLEQVPLLNLYEEFTRRGVSWTNYYTYVNDSTFHLTPEGHRLTSEIILDALRKQGWVGGDG